jgi:hypothetical protein
MLEGSLVSPMNQELPRVTQEQRREQALAERSRALRGESEGTSYPNSGTKPRGCRLSGLVAFVAGALADAFWFGAGGNRGSTPGEIVLLAAP